VHVALATGEPERPLPAAGGLRVLPQRGGGADGLLGPRRLSARLAAEALLRHRIHRTGFWGAKLVVTGARAVDDTVLRLAAAVLDGYGGTLYAGAGMGVTAADMAALAALSPYVLNAAGSGVLPHHATAHGVLGAIEAWAGGPPAGLRALVHGTGKVGAAVARELVAAGATVLTYDSAPGAAALPGCRPVRAWADTPVDVFVPCSVGDLLGPALAARLPCGAVIGSAGAVLADHPATAAVLDRRGVVHLPPPLVNAGAAIADSMDHYAPAALRAAAPAEVYGFVRHAVRAAATAHLLRAGNRPAGTPPLLPPADEEFCGHRFAAARAAPAAEPGPATPAPSVPRQGRGAPAANTARRSPSG
jgi:leucine dehydrogenase